MFFVFLPTLNITFKKGIGTPVYIAPEPLDSKNWIYSFAVYIFAVDIFAFSNREFQCLKSDTGQYRAEQTCSPFWLLGDHVT